jgi:transposase
MKKEDGRKIPRQALEYMRLQSIKLYKQGKEIKEISEFFGITLDAVYKWIRKYKIEGKKGLRMKKARGANPKLNNEDKKQIFSWLKKSAMEFGFETPLWDCKRIQRMIKLKLDKSIATSNLWETLRRWGLTPQKPEKDAVEKKQWKVYKWLREEWPKIEEHRRRWQAIIYFQDESSVSLIPVLGKTWAKKGKTPKIKTTSQRGSIPISSAISPSGRLLFRIEKEKVNSRTFVDFLKQIIKNHKWRKIIIVTDNYRPHKLGEIVNFLEENKNKIAVYYLPTYSPDLNPQEDVWKYLKHVKLKAHQARNKQEFKPLVLSKMRSIQRKPSLIKSFFIGSVLY